MAGPRESIYAGEAFTRLRELFAERSPVRPERLANPYFARPEPEELIYEEIEAIWAPIAERDDWSAFTEKLNRIEAARLAWGY